MYHPLKHSTIEKNIKKHQTGAVSLTPAEQVVFYNNEIDKAKSWIEYYTNPKNPKNANARMAAVHVGQIAMLEMKREEALALVYAAELNKQLPTFGGAMQLVKKEGVK